MPYELIWEERGVVHRHFGVASDDDLRQSSLAFVNHPQFETIEYSIVDFTGVTKFDFSADETRIVAERDAIASKRNPALRFAIVGGDLLQLGMSNMYRITFDAHGGTLEQHHFDTMEKARAWIAGDG